MDSDFSDSSNSNHTPTVSGATIDTSIKWRGGGSGKFVAASSQKVSYPDSADWNIINGDFVIRFGFRPTSLATQTICSHGSTASNRWGLVYINSDILRLYTVVSGSATNHNSSTLSLAVDTWYEIAVIRSGNTLYFFLDIAAAGSASMTVSTMPDLTDTLLIGANRNSSYVEGIYLDAHIDELVITDGVHTTSLGQRYILDAYTLGKSTLDQRYTLDAYTLGKSTLDQRYALLAPALEEATLNQLYALEAATGPHLAYLNQRYALDVVTGPFLVYLDQCYKLNGYPIRAPILHEARYRLDLTADIVYDAYTKMMLHMDKFTGAALIIDDTTWAHEFTPYGNIAIVEDQDAFGGWAAEFADDGDYADTPASENLNFYNGDPFTIDFKLERGELGTEQYVFGQGDNAKLKTSISVLGFFTDTNLFRFRVYNGSTDYTLETVSPMTDTTGYYHLACIFDGTNLKLYKDATLQTSVPFSGIPINNSPNNFAVGRIGEWDAEYFRGRIDEFRISMGVARTFPTVPTAAYGDYEFGEIELPMTAFKATHKADAPSSLSADVPNGKAYIDAITARMNGELYVTRIGTDENGATVTEEVSRVYLEKAPLDEKWNKTSLTLEGYRYGTPPVEKGVKIDPVKSRRTSGGKREVDPGIAVAPNPGDQAEMDDQLFTIGEVHYAVNTSTQRMKIKEK